MIVFTLNVDEKEHMFHRVSKSKATIIKKEIDELS